MILFFIWLSRALRLQFGSCAGAMWKEEETEARAAEMHERPQKGPRLELMGSGYGAADTQGVSSEPCSGCHPSAVEDKLDSLVAAIKSRKKAPMCEHCWLESFQKPKSGDSREDPGKQQRDRPRTLIMVCLECRRCLCAGVRVSITDYNPCGHAWSHARKKGHWFALWFDQPDQAYCFLCGSAWSLNPWPDTDQLSYVVRGIPNFGNTCYVNALVQCLLALDKMRTWMLGLTAPMRMGSLDVALKELFLETTPGNGAGAMLNPKKLLEILGTLDERYAGTTMEDSQELLLDMRNGLSEEEKVQWPPKVRDRYLTSVDKIFRGKICSTLICKCCLSDSTTYDSFSELSLTLPSRGLTPKSVDSPQRGLATGEKGNLTKFQTGAMDKDKASGPLKTDSTKREHVWQKENNAHGIWQTQADNVSCYELSLEVKENTSIVQFTPQDKGKALSRNFISGYEDSNSLASIEQCLAFNFKVEEVEWRCDICALSSEEAGSSRPVKSSASSSTANEESDHDGKAEKRIDMSIIQDSQSASIPLKRRKQIDLNIAYEIREDPNEQEDRKGHADKAVVISKLPPVLTVHLKRFEMVNNDQIKVPGHVSFDENLDVGQIMDPRSGDKDNSRYRLSGVIEHIGDSLHSGHNVAYVRANRIRSGSSLWFCANDDQISQVSLEEVLKCEAYILFYERMEG